MRRSLSARPDKCASGTSGRSALSANASVSTRSQDFHLRLRLCALALLGLLFVLALRLVYVQVFRHSYYSQRARNSHVRRWVLPAARGAILDRNGRALALSMVRESVFADPELMRAMAAAPGKYATGASGRKAGRNAPEEDLRKLADLLQIDPPSLQKLLQQPGQFVWLKRSAPETVVAQVAALKLRWVGVRNEEKRTYPYGEMAAQLLGFAGAEGKGLAGVENSRNAVLAGRAGEVSLEVDAKGRPIPGLRVLQVPPRSGRNLTLTLDASLQQIAETELAKGIKAAAASGGVALVMDPNNGEILALATQPAFDPNNFKKASPSRWTNPAVVGAYEPGSTFKIVVACGVLEEGEFGPSDQVYCAGEKAIGNRTIHCALHAGNRAHGQVNLEKIIEKSCNIGAATLGLRLGKDKLNHYVRAFGFGEKTGIELAGETPGAVPALSGWSDIRLANIAFGQGISVTPIQLLRAYCAVANGGLLVKPHLLLGRPGEEAPAPRVLSETTAREMRRLFVQVIESGTGKAAAVPGYLVAGKTGTAQKAVPGVGYKSGRYIGSFIGFVPADKPRLALLVLIDEPRGSHYGGVVAAPVFQQVASQALLQLGVPPSKTQTQVAANAKP